MFCSWLSYPHLPRAKGKHLHFAAQPRGADLRTGLPGQKWLSVAMSDWKKNGNPTISNRGSMFLQSIVCALNRIQDLHTQNSVCRCMCRICTCFSIACVVVSAHHFLHPLVHFQSFFHLRNLYTQIEHLPLPSWSPGTGQHCSPMGRYTMIIIWYVCVYIYIYM